MLAFAPLAESVDRMIEEHERKKSDLAAKEALITEKKRQRDALVPRIQLLEETRVFLQELAQVTRDEIMAGLQMVVTLCLQAIFGPHLRFEIEVDTKRNNTAVEFYVVDESGDVPVRLKPEDSMGGGVIDAISIGLRYGLLKVLNPIPKGFLSLDEPAKMVSADKIESIGQLLKELTQMFGKQTLLVTHHYSLYDIIDNPIYVRKENGVSICEAGLSLTEIGGIQLRMDQHRKHVEAHEFFVLKNPSAQDEAAAGKE